MKHLVISFKTRTSLYSFAKILKSNGIFTSTINTPRTISLSCGLSLQTEFRFLNAIKTIIIQSRISDLIGIFIKSTIGNFEQFERIYWL